MANATVHSLSAIGSAFASDSELYLVVFPFGVNNEGRFALNDLFTNLEKATSDGGLILGGVAAPAVSVAGKGKIYFDSTLNWWELSGNGSAFAPITVGGGQTGRLTYWQDARTVTTLPELQRTSDGALQFNAIAAPAVSAAGKGTLYFDNSANLLKLSQNAGGYQNVLSGSGTTNQLAYFSGTAGLTSNAFLSVNTASQLFRLNGPASSLIYQQFVNSTTGTDYAYHLYSPGTTDAFEFGFSSGGGWLTFYNDPANRYLIIHNQGGSVRDIFAGDDGTSATGATRGFLYIPAVPGTPNGVPANAALYTHTHPIVLDDTNNRLYGYMGGAWRNLSGITGSSTIRQVSVGDTSANTITSYSTFTYDNTTSGNLGVTAANAAHTAALFQGLSAQSAAIVAIRQNATLGTAPFLDCQTSTPSSLFTIDVNGQISKLRGVSYTWPSAQGAASTVLTNDGSGNLSWVAGGGGGTPGGSNKQIQYNNGAAFGGAAGFEYQSGASPNVAITGQNAVHTALRINSAVSPTAPVFEVSADNGTTVHFKVLSTGAPSAPIPGFTDSERFGGGNTFSASSATETTLLGTRNSISTSFSADRSVFIGRGINISGASNASNSVLIAAGSTGINLAAGRDISGSVVIGTWAIAPPNYAGQSVIIGSGNLGGALQNNSMVVIGTGMNYPEGFQSISIGANAQTRADRAITIGTGSSVYAVDSIAFGYQATVPTSSHTSSIAFGREATTTAANQLVAGSSSYPLDNLYFGKGVTNASPTAYTINGTGGSGTNIAGGALQLAGGKGTGNAAGGAINFQVAPAGSTGSSLNTLVTAVSVTPRQTLNFTALSGAAPSTGDLYQDSDSTAFAAVAGGWRAALGGTVFTNSGTKTITALTDTTMLQGTSWSSATIPANYLVTGKQIVIEGGGRFSTSATAGATVKLKLGGTVIASGDSGAGNLSIGITNSVWRFRITIVCTGTGTSGSVQVFGQADFYDPTALAWFSAPIVTTANQTVDTTTSQVIDVTFAWDSGSGHSATVTGLRITN